MIQFIKRVGNSVLWSHGNYQYEIEDRISGVKTKFESSYEEAIERLDRTNAIVDSPLYYTQDGGSMCNGIGRSYF
jgi:hypothetical protein